jgi:hypothetical protein
MSTAAVMNVADKASPSSVPATPKREVTTVAAGEAIPTARIFGQSMMFGPCGELKEKRSLHSTSNEGG